MDGSEQKGIVARRGRFFEQASRVGLAQEVHELSWTDHFKKTLIFRCGILNFFWRNYACIQNNETGNSTCTA